MYKVIKFFQDDKKGNKTIAKNLTLDEAKRKCNGIESKGKDWFLGFTKE